jgi:exocyst complex component 4
VLRTLHLSIRTTILLSLNTSVRPSIVVDSLLGDPDPTILTLNTQLVAFDTEVSTYIPLSSYNLITSGLAALRDIYLLSLCTSKLANMNANGAALMRLNMLVLQQNLKNIEDGASLPNVQLFFDLFTAGPEAIVARAKEHGKGFGVQGLAREMFTQEKVKKLLELTYMERLADERREAVVQAQRERDAQVLEISEFMY